MGWPFGPWTLSAFNCAQKRWSSALCDAVWGPLPLPEFVPPLAEVAPEPPLSIVGELTGWVVAPDGVVKLAEVTVTLPGHQASKRPLPIVVATRVPSLNTKVAADTCEPVEPSAMV
jgi:hypothetical protein